MKIRKLLGGLLLSTVLAAGIGVAIGTHQATIETKADLVYSKIYYVGSDNNWADPSKDDMTGYIFHYVGSKTVGSETSYYYELTLDLTKDSKFKIRDWESGHESDWMNSYNGLLCLEGLKNEDNSDANLRCTMTGNYTITYRWTSSSNRCVEGFRLNSAVDMFYVADNTTWAAASDGTIFIHAWSSSGDLTNWGESCPVNKVPSIKVGSNSYNFYHFRVPSVATGFIIKHGIGGTDYKTGNLAPSDGSCFSSNSTSDMGNAGAVIGNIYRHLGDYTYRSTDYSSSICAIDSTTIGHIVSAYKQLSNGALTIFDNSKLNTYDPTDLSKTADVSFAVILSRLQTNTAYNIARLMFVSSIEKNSSIIVIILITAISGAAVGGYFLFRKKKEN